MLMMSKAVCRNIPIWLENFMRFNICILACNLQLGFALVATFKMFTLFHRQMSLQTDMPSIFDLFPPLLGEVSNFLILLPQVNFMVVS